MKTTNTVPSTADMNRVIALFDGYEEYEDGGGTWFKKEGLIMCMHPKLENLKYHTDYNWLMSAWVKFRDSQSVVFEKGNMKSNELFMYYTSTIGSMILYKNIEVAHKALYDAIVWYNSLNTKP